VKQLFHPYSCYEHPDSVPGGNDTGLNIGYNGDSYGHGRAARVTCAKHHFTWMIQKVFSLTHKEIYESIGEQHDSRSIDTFFFTEEDYLLSPKIYDSIIAGLNAIDKYETNTDKNNGFFGLVFEPKSMNYRRNDYWYAGAFVSGPMTMNRHIFSKLQNNADKYCRFDDYNWDWSIVTIMNSEHVMPYIVLMPSQHLVKHIGIHGGMHSNKVKRCLVC
jgi:alpha-1,6-mannosyl-glycoprotein beta-1,2-N-acetylglucosaminyltransferase